MSATVDIEYNLAKRKICDIATLSALADIANRLHPGTPTIISIGDVVKDFEKWIGLYEKKMNHSVHPPKTRAAVPDASLRWSLASTVYRSELYLKVEDILECAVLAHSLGSREYALSALSNVRQARDAISGLLGTFASQISAEANSPGYAKDRSVIDPVIAIANLPEKFDLVSSDILERAAHDDKALAARMADTMQERDTTTFHERFSELGVAPIGLNPSFGRSATIVPLRLA